MVLNDLYFIYLKYFFIKVNIIEIIYKNMSYKQLNKLQPGK